MKRPSHDSSGPQRARALAYSRSMKRRQRQDLKDVASLVEERYVVRHRIVGRKLECDEAPNGV